MAENKAARELQSLLDMSGEAESARDAATVLQNTQREIGYNARPATGEASFSTPEAVATAIGSSLFLGPAGVLLGVAQGFLGKQAQQNELDAVADRNAALEMTDSVYEDTLSMLEASTTNDNDIEQLNVLRAQKDAAQKMLLSADPQMQQRGAAGMQSFEQRVNDYTVRQESDRITFEAQEQLLGRQTMSDFRSDLSTYDSQTENFAAIERSTQSIIESMNQGDAVSVMSALSQMPVLINPAAGAMTDGEFNLWQNVGGMVDGFIGKIEKELAGGGGLTDTTRRELIAEVEDLRKRNSAFQVMRDARYQGRAPVFGYTPEMTNEFNATKFVPEWSPGVFEPGRGPDTEADGDIVKTGEPAPIAEPTATPFQEANRRFNKLLREQAEQQGRPTN